MREGLVCQLPEIYRPFMRSFGHNFSNILRLFCSQWMIDIELYKKFCLSLNADFFTLFVSLSWVQIRPSVHKLLVHSWKLIDKNEGPGLKNFDESGLDGNNKVLRSVRHNLARKYHKTKTLKTFLKACG